jgi:membrane-bound ClpP family serine protease
MDWSIIIALLLAGILLLLAEILVLPGATVAGILGFVLIFLSIYFTYSTRTATEGHIVVASSVVLSAATLILALRSKTWKRLMLDRTIDSKVNVVDEEAVKVGDSGRSVSRLAPAGKGLINGQMYEVHTQGEFLDENEDFVVVRIDSFKIIVKPIITQ